MDFQPAMTRRPTGTSDVWAIGFGTTAVMWAVGYLGHMPLSRLPPAVMLGLMLAAVVGGGGVAGRCTARGLPGGLCVGAIVALLNLLVLGSLLVRADTGQLLPRAWLWIPGWFGLSLLLAGAGAVVGRRCAAPAGARLAASQQAAQPPNWLALWGWITAATALLLIAAGGLVTGLRAGMAVPDWPNTYGANMFLYPLAKMTGGVFYEHAHRLLGTLVGATTLALAVYLSLQRGRRGLSQFSSACPHGQAENGTVPFNGTVRLAAGLFWTAGACVLVQGILGGFRVTENSPALAVVHGFFAHVVLGLLVAAAVLLSDGRSGLRGGGPVAAWKVSGTLRVPSVEAEEGIADGTRSVPDTLPHRAAGPDLLLTGLLIGVVLLQTLLGTLVRQRDVTFMAHVAVAAVVAAVSLSAGMRAWGRHGDVPLLRRGGIALVLLVVLQIGLGIVSAAMRTPPVEQSPSAAVLAQGGGLRPALPALLTTAHQTTAALILAVGVLLGVGTGSRE